MVTNCLKFLLLLQFEELQRKYLYNICPTRGPVAARGGRGRGRGTRVVCARGGSADELDLFDDQVAVVGWSHLWAAGGIKKVLDRSSSETCGHYR